MLGGALLALFYLLVGVVFSIPYCFLAGWSVTNWPSVVMISPIFLLVWLFLASLAGFFDPHRGRGYQPSLMIKVFFWGWTIYCLLPIIAHWSAFFLNRFGYTNLALAIEAHRYETTLFVFYFVVILFIAVLIFLIVFDEIKRFSKKISRR